MATSGRRPQIVRRVLRAGLSLSPHVVQQLEVYLELLTRWNRRLNLTALRLEPLADESVDRLLVEPLQAARHVWASDRTAVDIGSGGGSPAIPLKLAVPHLHLTLVESKARKAAFLREVVRTLALRDTEVANCRFESLQSPPADLITLRAVRADPDLMVAARSRLRDDGRLLWFMSLDQTAPQDISEIQDFRLESEERLSPRSRLAVLRRS